METTVCIDYAGGMITARISKTEEKTCPDTGIRYGKWTVDFLHWNPETDKTTEYKEKGKKYFNSPIDAMLWIAKEELLWL